MTWKCAPVDGGGASLSDEVTSDASTGSIHALVTGLEAGRQYRYQFDRDGEQSEVGLFRTIPTDRPVRFAVVSCAKFNSGYFNGYRAVAERDDIDFVLHLGDYIYEAAEVPTGKQTPGANIGRPFEPLNNCVTREDYDARYAQYRRDDDLLLLHSRHAMIATIDDHELSDNAWSGGADEHDEKRDGPWADRVRAAMEVWSDWMPTMRRPQDGDPVWQEVSLGEAGRILLCETRLHRSEPDLPPGETKTELGLEERAFVLERLASPVDGCTFLAMPSMLSDLDAAMNDQDALFALHKLKMAEPEKPEEFHDLWDSFEYEQQAVMDALAGTPRGIAISGDVHFSAEHVQQRATGEFVEWTVTSITSPNLDDKMDWPRGVESRTYEEAMLRTLPNMKWCDLDSHGYLIVDAAPERASCQWWFVHEVREVTTGVTMEHEVVLGA